MALVHRPWIVRVLVYAGTGILIMLLILLIAGALAFLVWGVFMGPDWLQWTLSIPLILVLLTFVGRGYYWKEF